MNEPQAPKNFGIIRQCCPRQGCPRQGCACHGCPHRIPSRVGLEGDTIVWIQDSVGSSNSSSTSHPGKLSLDRAPAPPPRRQGCPRQVAPARALASPHQGCPRQGCPHRVAPARVVALPVAPKIPFQLSSIALCKIALAARTAHQVCPARVAPPGLPL